MKNPRSFAVLSAAAVFGAVAMAAQTLLLRRFLWRFESAETGVALFLSCWLLWSGAGAAAASTPFGRRVAGTLSRFPGLPVAVCAALYFAQYALIENLRGWLGVPEYQTFPLAHLALGCLAANAPFCFAAGWVIPILCHALERLSLPVSRAFAWEALGAAAGGAGLVALLVSGVEPDRRDEAEWFRFFPQAEERPGRFLTGGGTTLYGSHGGTFYALSSGGVREVLPEGDRAMELAVLVLSQRPYAESVLLAGQVPLAVGLALETLRPDLAITWCPGDAEYGTQLMAAAGLRTRVRAAGQPPQRFLAGQADGAFSAVMVLPPPATSLAGAAWRDAAFIREVRRVTQRTGVALFGLDCDVALLTPEKAALLDAAVRPLRQVWPESGVFVPGAGGWWIAAQVPQLAYGAEVAPSRFALLKRTEVFPAEAVARLYEPERARRLARQCPVLETESAVFLPDQNGTEAVLAAGLADAIRAEYPASAPGQWVDWVKRNDGLRLFGLFLVGLWMMPVALGMRATAPRRLAAAWLASCGALGFAVSLSVLYRLQMRFGALYLLAGVGSCLYLGGLFFGNRIGEWTVRLAGRRPALLRWALVAATAVLAGVAVGVLRGVEGVEAASGMVSFCLLAGVAAGVSVPLALAVAEEHAAPNAAVFVLADALGGAVAGLFFTVLVPLAGMTETVLCFAVLACGLSVCVALSGPYARLTSGLALAVVLAILGGRMRDVWPDHGTAGAAEDAVAPGGDETSAERTPEPLSVKGIPRKIDVPLIQRKMGEGQLSTNAAAFWE